MKFNVKIEKFDGSVCDYSDVMLGYSTSFCADGDTAGKLIPCEPKTESSLMLYTGDTEIAVKISEIKFMRFISVGTK